MAQTGVTIIGLGKVGTAFLNVFPPSGYAVHSVFSRSFVDEALQKKHPDTIFNVGIPQNIEELDEWIFITVADDAISEVSRTLAENFSSLEGKNIIHCSGTLSAEVLDDVKKKGARTASFHPIKSITKKTNSFQRTWFDMDGQAELLEELEEMAKSFGAHSFCVKPEAKPFLHASAVVASNYLVVLSDLVTQISSKGGISEDVAIKAFVPLMRNTLSNIEEFGNVDALTGPISRGDVETIKKHLQSLKNDEDLSFLYKELGKVAVEIAQKKAEKPDTIIKIKKLLS